ncbi:MAG: roadblock/LC7 domain-containing protein [Zoogloea sp.]|uniref:roadblock/LC7 domain-containing protein n=1 Tax=Zoogloea sp. TaxID=49181 RepID=UPI003F3169B9
MLEIVPGSYLTVTPSGAWHAIARADENAERRALLSIMHEASSPLLSTAQARTWTACDNDEAALDVLLRLQEKACLEAWPEPRPAPSGTLEETLPALLAGLSDTHQAVLADSMGFCLASAGYDTDTAEALAAVGADILSVAERQSKALSQLGDHLLDGWGNVDAAGISGLSFWPMHIGKTRLALTVSGRPRFNQRAFADLVWTLCVRYGEL